MRLISFVFAMATSMVGYSIHKSVFWSVVDFFFCPLAWCKWLFCHEVTMTVIKSTFSWFFV